MGRFTLPRDLYHGKGALEELKNLKGSRAVVVVGGGSMKRFGFLQKAVDYLKEAGMEVVYSGLHRTVDQIVNIAVQEDVDVIGLSIMTGAHIPITQRLFEKIKERGISDKMVFVGGVIPSRDVPKLKELGAAGVFPGGTPLAETIQFLQSVAIKG